MQVLSHQSVFLQQAIDALQIIPNGIYVDATFGRGGHACAIRARLAQTGHLVVIDQDHAAIQQAQEIYQNDTQVSVIHGSFVDLKLHLKSLGIVEIHGILFDLGVSAPQLDDPQRGFSFMHDGPLDMRMDQRNPLTAAVWIAKASEKEIADILFQYGEERYARRIAKAIVSARKQAAIVRTGVLAEIIKAAHPRWPVHKHPATQSFLAIRLWINQELAVIPVALTQAVACLKAQGRLVVIAFHSLEDRLVKQLMQKETQDLRYPPGLPVPQAMLKPRLRIVQKAARVDLEEHAANRRARSAVLRVAERCG